MKVCSMGRIYVDRQMGEQIDEWKNQQANGQTDEGTHELNE